MISHNSRKTTLGCGYLDAILVIAGQAAVILPIIYEELTGFFIPAGIALGAAGLGVRAKRTGRSVISWVLLGLFFPVLIPFAGLVFMLARGVRPPPSAAPPGERQANVHVHALVALAIFLVSAIVMDSLGFGIMSVLAAIIWVASRAGRGCSRRARLAMIGVYVLALAMVFGVKVLNYRVSHANARVIIAACEAYKEKKGEYPAELQDLVPGCLSEVPRARYTVMSGGFWYHRDAGPFVQGYRLVFVNEAPFARMVYSSTRGDWHSID